MSNDESLLHLNAAGVELEGNLSIPPGATGVVLFAHGSGSSRFSSRNRYVAEFLRKEGGNLGLTFHCGCFRAVAVLTNADRRRRL